MCCNPWWGIISFPLIKEGIGSLSGLKAELARAIRVRSERIMENYVTSETPKRALFRAPEKYNISLSEIKASGNTLSMTILAVFAFRCAFVSKEGACTIHPSVLGKEIRPPHCGLLGRPGALPGEKGYCRIIHAAQSPSGEVDRAIELENSTKAKYLSGGVDSVEEAAEKLIGEIRDFCSLRAPHLLPAQRKGPIGRNDPCHCGSGRKYKKCCG